LFGLDKEYPSSAKLWRLRFELDRNYVNQWYHCIVPYYKKHFEEVKDFDYYESNCFPKVNPLKMFPRSCYPKLVNNELNIMMDGKMTLHTFSERETRFFFEVNIMRAKFLQCISYDSINSSSKGTTIKTTSAYSKLIEACIVPCNMEMELTFGTMLNNAFCDVTEFEHEYTRRESIYKKKESKHKSESKIRAKRIKLGGWISPEDEELKNQWILPILIKSEIIPHHVIMESISKAVEKWERNYLTDEDPLKNLDHITNKGLRWQSIKDEAWLNKYDHFVRRNSKDCLSPFSYDVFQVNSSTNQSIPYCTDIIYNCNALGFDTFDVLYKEFIRNTVDFDKSVQNGKINIQRGRVLNKESRVFKWMSKFWGDEIDFLKEISELLVNTPFPDFLTTQYKQHYPEIEKCTIFWTFLYSICYLQSTLYDARIQIGKNVKILKERVNDMKDPVWFDVMNGCSSLYLNGGQGPVNDVDTNRNRAFLQACHVYSTCFLSMASWFKNRIKTHSSIEDDYVPIDLIQPWPEKSLSWHETPDVSYALQNINFWHGHVTVLEDAVSAQFQKALPFRSQGRSVDRKITQGCGESESLNGFYKIIIRNTLFGMYDDMFLPFNHPTDEGKIDMVKTYSHIPVNYRPSFGTMLCLYDAFFNPYSDKNLKNKMLITWANRDSKTIATIIKELLINLMMRQPQYIVNQTTFDWKIVWFRNTIVSNIMRLLIDQHVTYLYSNRKTYQPTDLLRDLPKNIENVLFSNPSCFLKQCTKTALNIKLYNRFKIMNESIIISNIKLMEDITLMERRIEYLKAIGENVDQNLLEELHEKKEILVLNEFELSDDKKREIWTSMLGIVNTTGDRPLLTIEKLKDDGLLNFLTEEETKIMFIIITYYTRNVSPQQIEDIMPNLSVVHFKTLYFVLKLFKIIESIQIISLDERSIKKIDKAMRRRFNILPGRPLLSKAFHTYYAFCCRRICGIHDTKRKFGNENVSYNMRTKTFSCTKRRIKKPPVFNVHKLIDDVHLKRARSEALLNMKEEDEVMSTQLIPDSILKQDKSLTPSQKAIKFLINSSIISSKPGHLGGRETSIFSYFADKTKKKIARAIHRLSGLDCLKNPNVLTIDMRGKMIIDKKCLDKPKKYMNCHRCGHLHNYQDDYWVGPEYYCAHCWAEKNVYTTECLCCLQTKNKKMEKVSNVNNIPGVGQSNPITSSQKSSHQNKRMSTLKKSKSERKLKTTKPIPTIFSDNSIMGDVDMESFKSSSSSTSKPSNNILQELRSSEQLTEKLLNPSSFGWEQKYNALVSGEGQYMDSDHSETSHRSTVRGTSKRKQKRSKSVGSKVKRKANIYNSSIVERELFMITRNDKIKLIEKAQRISEKKGKLIYFILPPILTTNFKVQENVILSKVIKTRHSFSFIYDHLDDHVPEYLKNKSIFFLGTLCNTHDEIFKARRSHAGTTDHTKLSLLEGGVIREIIRKKTLM
jgi:hypothetical protein